MSPNKTQPKAEDFITIDDVLVLLKDMLGLTVTRTAIYNYGVRKNFPKHIGLGSPRLYRRQAVLDWIKTYTA